MNQIGRREVSFADADAVGDTLRAITHKVACFLHPKGLLTVQGILHTFEAPMAQAESVFDQRERACFDRHHPGLPLKRLHASKRRIRLMKRSLARTREAILNLRPVFEGDLPHWQDLEDQVERLQGQVDELLDSAVALMNLELNLEAQRTNEVMRFLTIIQRVLFAAHRRLRVAWVPQARLAALILAASATLRAQAPTWEALEARGAKLAVIRIEVLPVFDMSNPHEDTWVGRLANTIHINTHDSVVRHALTLHPGDLVDARKIRENERNLRSFRFIKDAEIIPDVGADGSVTAVVRVHDAWTLKVSVGYSQVGGRHSWGFGLRDQNLLGSGKEVSLRREVDPDRVSNTVAYRDHQVFGSRWDLSAEYQSLSDGYARSFDLTRPFFTLDTRWSFEVGASTTHTRFLEFDHNALIYDAPSVLDSGVAGFAWRAGGGADEAWRVGLRLDLSDARYGPVTTDSFPPTLPSPTLSPRRLRGPSFTLDWFQDGFRAFRDLEGMDNPEDYNLGWSGQGALGVYTRAWGSSETAPFGRLGLQKGWMPSDESLLLAQGYAQARRGPTGLENAQAGGTFTVYRWGFPHQVLAGYMAVDTVHRPDPESLLYLGGFEGLRGYTDHVHPGDRRWIASVEERILTDWRWLGILRVGFVVYADAGAIHQLDGLGWSRTYADIGGGLRFGDLKSSLGRVVLLTLAYPLVKEPGQDKWQLVVGNAVRF